MFRKKFQHHNYVKKYAHFHSLLPIRTFASFFVLPIISDRNCLPE